LYLIHKGSVKLYAENGYPFVQYKQGDQFGECDLLCNTRRLGSAQASENCLLYKIEKTKFEYVLSDYPKLRRDLIARAIRDY
jgi:CRP-like cAMP-binding protein